jgi:hypothetical protein
MTTIKIKSTDVASQGEFVIIDLLAFDSASHEPFDDEARAALAGAVASGEVVPTASELLSARDALLAREREVAAAEERVAAQAAANELEAQRLRDEAAAQAAANELEAQRLRDEAAAQAAAAQKKPGIADLRDALTAKGIAFDPAASKADLQALLDAAGA